MFGVRKTAFIGDWEQNWKALACIVWDRGSKDNSGLDGPEVATEQYMYSHVRHLVILRSAWSPCWCLR